MVSYDAIITPKALEQLNSYVDYIQYALLNPMAADAVWQDALRTRDMLQKVAGSLQYCENPDLKALGYRPIKFENHNYVMLFRVENTTAYVEGIYHLMQDYENNFAQSLEKN